MIDYNGIFWFQSKFNKLERFACESLGIYPESSFLELLVMRWMYPLLESWEAWKWLIKGEEFFPWEPNFWDLISNSKPKDSPLGKSLRSKIDPLGILFSSQTFKK